MSIFGKKKKVAPQPPEPTKKQLTEAEKEFELKLSVKKSKQELDKIIKSNIEAESKLINQAADMKMKGFGDLYKSCIMQIKTVRVRKMQAEKYKYQIDTMLTMRDVSKSSTQLLNVMTELSSTLGMLTLDSAAIIKNQQQFEKTQFELQRQTDSIENALSSFSDSIEMDFDTMGYNLDDRAIEDEIDNRILGQTAGLVDGGTVQNSTVDTKKYDDVLNS